MSTYPSSSYSFSPLTPTSANQRSAPSNQQNGDWDNIFDDTEKEWAEEEEEVPTKDCVIFLIDCRKPMFLPNSSGEIPFEQAIKTCVLTITDKIISHENDAIGVVLFGTKTKSNDIDFENIVAFQQLDVPDAPRILALEQLIDNFDSQIGSMEGEFKFHDALWTCKSMFNTRKDDKATTKRIWLFTNDDNPNANDNNRREQSFQHAKDMAELGIDIELFALKKESEKFDIRKFYQNIISISEEDLTGHAGEVGLEKLSELESIMRRKEYKKRSLGRLPLKIGDSEVAVRLFNLVQEAKKGSYIWLDERTNERIKSQTKYICEDTGATLTGDQIGYYFPYGGEKIKFTKQELKELKTIDTPGIRLLGFKDKSALKDYYHYRSSSFIYPDEKNIEGSTTAISAILTKMEENNKIAICRMVLRAATQAKFVALLPQKEIVEDGYGVVQPSGFSIIYLPYADDLRSPPIVGGTTANGNQLNAAKSMIKGIRFPFNSYNFQNPALQKHYAVLQAVALDRESVELPADLLMPDEEGFAKNKDRFLEFIESVGLDKPDISSAKKPRAPAKKAAAPKKRARKEEEGDLEEEEEGDTKKRKRAPKEAPAMSEEDYKNPAKVNKMTVPQLKEYLKEKKIKVPAKAKKSDLVSLVLDG